MARDEETAAALIGFLGGLAVLALHYRSQLTGEPPGSIGRTLSAARGWLGETTGSARVQQMLSDYETAWEWPAPDPHADWCAMVVMEWLREGLQLEPWPISVFRAPIAAHPFGLWWGNVSDLAREGERRGYERELPEPGDVYVNSSLSHAGLVESVDSSGVNTIDGNWSSSVTRRSGLQPHGLRYFRWA